MRSRRLLTALTLAILVNIIAVAKAAPTGEMTLISDPDNFLTFTTVGTPGEIETVTVRFTNTASATITDVSSTIQFITLGVANLNPSRVVILNDASWTIHDPSSGGRPDLTGTVTGTQESTPAYYSPYSTSTAVDIWRWNLGIPDGASSLAQYTASNQFQNDLRILRPGEWTEFRIQIQCAGQVGDSRIWFFFRATEFAPTSVPVTDLSTIPAGDRMNIYYQNTALPVRPVGWYPLHISYDPYDSDIGTGHSFEQVSSAPLYGWTRIPTTTRFAKTNKLVHQTKTSEEGSTIHICGTKFLDLNSNGIYDPQPISGETEPGINGVTVMLLGADAQTLASQYSPYIGKFSYPPPENIPPLDVLKTGENGLTGSYCFNLINVKPGTYTFFVKIVEPKSLTTPALIGPIVITVSNTSPATEVFSIDHDFGNKPAVGGVLTPIDLVAVLSPYLASAGLMVAALIMRKRRKQTTVLFLSQVPSAE